MRTVYEQPISRKVVLEKDKLNDNKYKLRVLTETLASYESLTTPVKERREVSYVLRNSLQNNQDFLKEEVNRYLDFPWGSIDFLPEEVEKLLQKDHLVITCNFCSGLLSIGSLDSGAVIVDYDGKKANICRCHNTKSPVDVFDCIQLQYTHNNIQKTFEYAER